MSRKGIVSLSVALAIFLTLFFGQSFRKEKRDLFSRGEVRGVTVISRGVSYTLNFEQQQLFLGTIDREKRLFPHSSPTSDFKVVVHHFNQKDSVLTPTIVDSEESREIEEMLTFATTE